jgi:nitrogen regulatory protein PII
VQQALLEEILDAFDGFDVSSLTVLNGCERCRPGTSPVFYKGSEYQVRTAAVVIVDATVPDHQVEEIVQVVGGVCSTATRSDAGRILVMAVEECHHIRARRIVA